jgi:DNA repair exonuclease SbcCD ATPase subunit
VPTVSGHSEGGGASKSTDPAAGTSTGTDVSLREYLTSLIENARRECKANVDSLREQVEAQDKAGKEAIAKALESVDRRFESALASIDKRFDSVNEFRDALGDLSNRMATQDALHGLSDKVEAAQEAMEARFEGFYQHNRTDILQLTKRIDMREGQAIGSKITTTTLVTIVTVAIGLIGTIVVLANYFSSR